MKNVIDQLSCCLDKSLPDNTANCCLNTKVLRYGECKLSREQVKDITFILAHDLLEFANNNGDMRIYLIIQECLHLYKHQKQRPNKE